MQTVTGVLTTPEGSPLKGVSVQLVRWETEDVEESSEADEAYLGGTLSWGDTDEEGRFAIPVRLPDTRVEVTLELLALSGESLGEPAFTVDPEETLHLGTLTAPPPREGWADEEMEPVYPSKDAFEHPLG